MLISLVIPVYNVSDYLHRLKDTAVSQTYKELEIILVDDGSTDTTGDICDEYSGRDSRIRVIHTPNRGVADARNTGIDVSNGSYIIFADGDDYLAEDYVEYLYSLCVSHNADAACCAWTLDNNGTFKICSYRKNEPGLYNSNHEAMRALMTTRLLSSSMWGKIFRKELFYDVRFPEGTNYYEDDATMYRLISKAESVVLGGEAKYFYTLRHDSMIHRSFNDNNLNMIKVFEERCSFIESNYPELAVYARSDVLMSVNHCVIKMCDEGLLDHPCIAGLKIYYRKYERDYLKGISYLPAKLFSIAACIDIKAAMRLYRLTGKHTRIN